MTDFHKNQQYEIIRNSLPVAVTLIPADGHDVRKRRLSSLTQKRLLCNPFKLILRTVLTEVFPQNTQNLRYTSLQNYLSGI